MLAQGGVLQQEVAAVGEGVAYLCDRSHEEAKHHATLGSDRVLGPHRPVRKPEMVLRPSQRLEAESVT